jgi:tol-pal system protein YbgF
MRRVLSLALVLGVALSAPGRAQDNSETLADIRQELSVLYVELQKLKRELSTTGGVSDVQVGGTVIDRVNALEAEVQRLTAKTEQLEFRIDSVVSDGTNRVGDLEFRLCELEPDCDIATLEPGATLGGVEPSTGSTVTGTDAGVEADTGTDAGIGAGGVELAVGEQADFDSAMAAFEAGDYAAAAEQFALFQTNYPGGPLSAIAGLKRGEALEAAGDLTGAARAYLDTFSSAPNGDEAPQALFLLGQSLGRLGQTNEACVTLGEVEVRFPQSDAVLEARSAMRNIGCQ